MKIFSQRIKLSLLAASLFLLSSGLTSCGDKKPDRDNPGLIDHPKNHDHAMGEGLDETNQQIEEEEEEGQDTLQTREREVETENNETETESNF